jgi:hypothetical protein
MQSYGSSGDNELSSKASVNGFAIGGMEHRALTTGAAVLVLGLRHPAQGRKPIA